ncbi:MAG: NADH-quinone oxidoreductase subunit C [Endomicrobia bacterium]|nr:NADH-quinone oxidoreductase subunit C [Endomicrobiia bacterium]MCL2507466.1 NADH-quinone oxidoreductase subunit C [Endomicrobiia bacterium]
MENNHPMVEKIISKYPALSDKIKIQRENRLWMKIDYPDFRKFLEFAAADLKVDIFCMLTGLDEKENYSFIYHMADLNGLMLNIETSVPKTNASIATITDLHPAAELQERELTDLLGVTIEGMPKGQRYPLPDDWPEGEYPLRKDWTADRLDKKAEDING